MWAVQLSLDPMHQQKELEGTGSSSPRMILVRPISPTEGPDLHGAGRDGQQDYGDYLDDLGGDDDDSGEEDSDDESLCNKLCTYTQTQKEFMNQHW